MLKEILNTPPRTVPTMRIYPNFLSFNAPAAALLQLEEDGSVAIMQDDRDGLIYVANCSTMKQSYPLQKRGNTYRVSNAPLCRVLADKMDGFGTYLITQDLSMQFMEKKFYNIFKKKYEKD